jgi:hypothetical protein
VRQTLKGKWLRAFPCRNRNYGYLGIVLLEI